VATIAIVRKDWLVPGSTPSAGGAERFAIDAARRARALGHEVTIAGIPAQIDPVLASEFPVVPIDAPHGGSARKNRLFASVGAATVARLRERGVRVLTLSQVPAGDVYRVGDGLHRVWLERDQRRGIGRTLARLLTPRHRTILSVEDELFRAPIGHLVTNSELVAGHIRARFPDAAPRVRVIRTGINLDHFSPVSPAERYELRLQHGIYDTRPIFLIVGHNAYRKGIDRAIRAVAAESRAYLWVLGAKLPVPPHARDRIRMVSVALDGRDIRDLYRAASAVLVPSRYDPLAQVTGEALACGTPVITSDWNGGCEYGPSEALVTITERDGEEAFQTGLNRAVTAWADRDAYGRLSPAARALAERWPAEPQLDALIALVVGE
jgi:UDP-glucose:(heptosyl)LPS alpha-1,3-glucosyltransferase